eukprot:TRINITY_DN508_c0_g2_i1.p1 TRINITY_DN508_c0_g2~~TRINITY_DN508_c0_g2_i1.p1  ORF type:complete len:354 (+),score=46.14 TRINITY_DN508_c0_g2_i1:200-1261(+)
MASNQLTDAPSDQKNLVESLGQLDIGKEESVGYNAGLVKPRSGLVRTSSTASSTSSSLAGEAAPTEVGNAEGSVGSEAIVSDGFVQKKPPSGILQSVAGKISQTVTSAKDAIVGKKDPASPLGTASITGRAGAEGEDVLELDAHNKDKVGNQIYSTAGAKAALTSAGTAIANSAVAAKDAVVGVVYPTAATGTESDTASSQPGILQTVGTKIVSSAQYVKGAVTGKSAATGDSVAPDGTVLQDGEVASPTGKGIFTIVGEKVTQSAQYIKQTVQSKAVTDPANPEKVNVTETAKAALKVVGDKVSEGTAYVREAAFTKTGPYSQGPPEPTPETDIVTPDVAVPSDPTTQLTSQ